MLPSPHECFVDDLLKRWNCLFQSSLPNDLLQSLRRGLLVHAASTDDTSCMLRLPSHDVLLVPLGEFVIQCHEVSFHWIWEDFPNTCLITMVSNQAHVVPFRQLHTQEEGTNLDDEEMLHTRRFLAFSNLQVSMEHTTKMNTHPTMLGGMSALSSSLSRLFVKVDRWNLLGTMMEWSKATLSGSLSFWNKPENSTMVLYQSAINCEAVSLYPSMPASSRFVQEKIFLATLISWMDRISLPSVNVQMRTTKCLVGTPTSTTIDDHTSIVLPAMTSTDETTLGDVFRHVYNSLEDMADLINGRLRSTTAKLNVETAESSMGSNPSSFSSSATRNSQPRHKSGIRGIRISQGVSDSFAITAGCVVTGANFLTPVGIAVSRAAMGIKDGVVAAAKRGQQTRNDADRENSTRMQAAHQCGQKDNEQAWISRGMDSAPSSCLSPSIESQQQQGGYKFGDVTRGIISSARDFRDRKRSTSAAKESPLRDFGSDGFHPIKTETDYTTTSVLPQKSAAQDATTSDRPKLGRYAGVAGSSIGANVGLKIIGGPIGFLAGSVLGSQAAQVAVEQRSDAQRKDSKPISDINRPPLPTLSRMPPPPGPTKSLYHGDDEHFIQQLNRSTANSNQSSEPTKPYRFGDVARNIVAQGKKANGRDESSSYRLGDFSRGLFGGGVGGKSG